MPCVPRFRLGVPRGHVAWREHQRSRIVRRIDEGHARGDRQRGAVRWAIAPGPVHHCSGWPWLGQELSGARDGRLRRLDQHPGIQRRFRALLPDDAYHSYDGGAPCRYWGHGSPTRGAPPLCTTRTRTAIPRRLPLRISWIRRIPPGTVPASSTWACRSGASPTR